MLTGLRVIELGAFITAPLAAMMLADLGADVIKVERPEGDSFRGQGDKYAATFLAFNRNKRSVVLDATTEDGRRQLLHLIATADVLIDNFRPGVLARMGLDVEELRARHPRLVHCSITGFGDRGPYRERPAFDHVGQALSGVMSLMVDPACPEAFGPTITDNVTGMYACYGVLGALLERQATGKGRRIEVNMLEGSMAFIQDIYTNLTRTGAVAGKFSRVSRSQAFVLTCADDKMLAVHMSTTEKFWRELVAALGASGLAEDERFCTHQARTRNYAALSAVLQERFRARPREAWIEVLGRTDLPFAPVNSVADALEDPQVQALGSVAHMSHPVEGEVAGIACPILVDGGRPLAHMRPPPRLGEHTQEVLAELSKR